MKKKRLKTEPLPMRCAAPETNFGIVSSLREHKKHPIVFKNGIIGTAGHEDSDLFAVYANGDGHYIDFGIVEGSLLVVDRHLPYQANALNVFNLTPAETECPMLKISRTEIEGCECAGRIIMAINQYG